MLSLHRFVFNPFQENTYVLADTDTRQAAVIDPGMSDGGERHVLDQFIADNKLTLSQIVNTHMHVDHCFGVSHVRGRYGASLAASALDAPLGLRLAEQARRFGLGRLFAGIEGVDIDRPLSDGDFVTIGNSRLQVIAVPGHSPGGIALYDAGQKFVITGDSLFRGSIGRTDLPGGDYATLVRSVTERLLTLPDDTAVLPGHGPQSTVALERTQNPYL